MSLRIYKTHLPHVDIPEKSSGDNKDIHTTLYRYKSKAHICFIFESYRLPDFDAFLTYTVFHVYSTKCSNNIATDLQGMSGK